MHALNTRLCCKSNKTGITNSYVTLQMCNGAGPPGTKRVLWPVGTAGRIEIKIRSCTHRRPRLNIESSTGIMVTLIARFASEAFAFLRRAGCDCERASKRARYKRYLNSWLRRWKLPSPRNNKHFPKEFLARRTPDYFAFRVITEKQRGR